MRRNKKPSAWDGWGQVAGGLLFFMFVALWFADPGKNLLRSLGGLLGWAFKASIVLFIGVFILFAYKEEN